MSCRNRESTIACILSGAHKVNIVEEPYAGNPQVRFCEGRAFSYSLHNASRMTCLLDQYRPTRWTRGRSS
jgi:hypothetical protein